MRRVQFTIALGVLLSFAALSNQAATPIWVGEAEDAVLSGTAEAADGCENASHGGFVKMFNVVGNAVSFNNVEIGSAGTYELRIYYFQALESKVELVVNSISLGELTLPAGQWCYLGPASTYSVDIELEQGTNTVELKVVEGTTGPFVDKISVIDPDFTHVSRNYYISDSEGDDSNDGLSAAFPYKSLEKISSAYIGPGDSILFKSGDSFIGQLLVNGSGSPDTMVVVSSYGEGDMPVLDGANAVGGAHLTTIMINNQSYIKIENLEITNDRLISRSGVSDQLAYGIYVHNDGDEIMSNLIFKHLTIRDIFALSIDGVEFNSIKVAGIGFKSEKNTIAGKEKHIRDVLVDSCYFTRTTRYGIHTAHGGGNEGIGNDSLNRNMNLVFRNSHYYQTGGSCITPGRSYNCLVENNIFDYPGSDVDSRMAARGSGAWFWSCMNVIAQYNKTYHVRGNGDSYGMHIDFGNENVILQYNYSEDSEGGFVEILGKNLNSVYRFNVSVNDGIRDFHGNTLWVSDFAGSNSRIRSQENYIYNNSVYVNNNISPDILITSFDTYIYNNIFVAEGAGQIGAEVEVDIAEGSTLSMSNNLYYGNVSGTFRSYDSSPVLGTPLYANPGGQDIESYKLLEGSGAIGAGKSFAEPEFPNAGKGIFKHVDKVPKFDLYGNPVDLANSIPSIGAFNADLVSINDRSGNSGEVIMSLYPNPVVDQMHLSFSKEIFSEVEVLITDFQGRVLQSDHLNQIDERVVLDVHPDLRNGMYVFHVLGEDISEARVIVVRR